MSFSKFYSPIIDGINFFLDKGVDIYSLIEESTNSGLEQLIEGKGKIDLNFNSKIDIDISSHDDYVNLAFYQQLIGDKIMDYISLGVSERKNYDGVLSYLGIYTNN